MKLTAEQHNELFNTLNDIASNERYDAHADYLDGAVDAITHMTVYTLEKAKYGISYDVGKSIAVESLNNVLKALDDN